eukprot:6492306-Amphidinium_carterae.4
MDDFDADGVDGDLDALEQSLGQLDARRPAHICWSDDAATQVSRLSTRLQTALLNKSCIPYFVEWCNTPMHADPGASILRVWLLSIRARAPLSYRCVQWLIQAPIEASLHKTSRSSSLRKVHLSSSSA